MNPKRLIIPLPNFETCGNLIVESQVQNWAFIKIGRYLTEIELHRVSCILGDPDTYSQVFNYMIEAIDSALDETHYDWSQADQIYEDDHE